MITAIFISTFACVCMFTIGIMMKGETAIVKDRLNALKLLVEQDVEMVVPELSTSFGERVIRPWLGRI